MRGWRGYILLLALAALAGCLNVEARVRIFQDGSGLYIDRVEIPKNLVDLTLNQSGFGSTTDLTADAAFKITQQLENVAGVRLLDASGEWMPGDLFRLTFAFGFDSLEQWNAFAAKAQKVNLQMTSKALEPIKGKEKQGSDTEWNVVFHIEAGAVPPIQGAEDGATADPSLAGMGLDMGSVKIILAGPAPAAPTDFAPGADPKMASRQDDGSVLYSGGLTMLASKKDFQARYIGRPLAPEELAKQKAAAAPTPSADFPKVMRVVNERMELERAKASAQTAVTESFFDLSLRIRADNLVELSSTRTYYGPIAATYAGREAMLQTLIPELSADYEMSVKKIGRTGEEPGLAIIRTRRRPLPFDALSQILTRSKADAQTEYTINIKPLIDAGDLDQLSATTLGRVTLETPDPISGTNGNKITDHQVEMTFTAQQLQESSILIVRTGAAGK